MTDQDAQDINQMMGGTSGVVSKPTHKSKFGWVVLGCVAVGVIVGIVVYSQSIKPKPSTTPRPSVKTALPSPATNLAPPPTASGKATSPKVNVVGENDPDYGEYEIDAEEGLYMPTSPAPSSSSPIASNRVIALASTGASPLASTRGTTASPLSSPLASGGAIASASARTTMPDTTEGVPVTGIFEVTVGTVSLGLILLVAGLVGLLAL